MEGFITEDFLLNSKTARVLFHEHAKNLPIIDYHCHIEAKDIAMDQCYENITQVSLGSDHYKWRAMRSNGVDERYITGDASDEEKFFMWAKTLTNAIGNSLYHWMHLELKNYFDYDGILNEKTAKEVWELCNKKLQEPDMSVRKIIERSNVMALCTSDDPLDTLEYHTQLAKDDTFETKVYPTWRADKCLGIDSLEFFEYIQSLSDISSIKIMDYQSLTAALINRLDYFALCDCRTGDHAFDNFIYRPVDEKTVDNIIKKALKRDQLSSEEIVQYKSMILLFLAKEYHARDWVMQLHFGVTRDVNTRLFRAYGPNAGCDCMGSSVNIDELTRFFDALEITNQLPKTLIFSLYPTDNAAICAMIGCFQGSSIQGKIQQGVAWWFNDTKTGIETQLTDFANFSLLGNFVGMLTDSRSFLSYPRHEYFRRILCNLIGGWVDKGEYNADLAVVGEIVQNISFYNADKYFHL